MYCKLCWYVTHWHHENLLLITGVPYERIVDLFLAKEWKSVPYKFLLSGFLYKATLLQLFISLFCLFADSPSQVKLNYPVDLVAKKYWLVVFYWLPWCWCILSQPLLFAARLLPGCSRWNCQQESLQRENHAGSRDDTNQRWYLQLKPSMSDFLIAFYEQCISEFLKIRIFL